MIIDEVMNGPIPKARIDTLPSAPPVNKSRNPMILLPLAILANIWLLIPYKGI